MRGIHVAWLLIWALVLIWMAAWSLPVRAHDWYPPICCSDKDCYPISWDEIDITPEGYTIRATGEVIPFGSERRTPPEGGGMFHRCSVNGDPAQKTMGMSYGEPCFWAPEMGS